MVITTSSTQETLNPFVHRVELTTTYEKLKVSVYVLVSSQFKENFPLK